MSIAVWDRLMERLAVMGYSQVPAPIAPQAQADACLCEACECCADNSLDVPVEARS